MLVSSCAKFSRELVPIAKKDPAYEEQFGPKVKQISESFSLKFQTTSHVKNNVCTQAL